MLLCIILGNIYYWFILFFMFVESFSFEVNLLLFAYAIQFTQSFIFKLNVAIVMISPLRTSSGIQTVSKLVWPSGLRRQTQDLMGVSPREFKSHRMHTFYPFELSSQIIYNRFILSNLIV